MNDYRFVSAPEVVLEQNKDGSFYFRGHDVGFVSSWGHIHLLLAKGIIEPVPVEIPDHVVEAANRAYFANHQWFAEKGDAMRAALIAAKQAEEAGE